MSVNDFARTRTARACTNYGIYTTSCHHSGEKIKCVTNGKTQIKIVCQVLYKDAKHDRMEYITL